MTEPYSPEHLVLAGMLSGGVPVIDEVVTSLSERHFVDPVLRELFIAVRTYRGVAAGVVTVGALADLARDAALDAGTAALLEETYVALLATPVAPSDTRWAVARVRTERERIDTAAALSDATEIVSGSVTDGEERIWSGPGQAREWVTARFAEIEADTAIGVEVGADVRTELSEILSSYATAHQARVAGVSDGRPRFGVSGLDSVMEGLGRGELCLVAAPPNVGKTHLCVQLMYNAVVEQGLHVYFATSETLRGTVRARLLARHSRCPWFEEERERAGASTGLDSAAIERGALPAAQVRLFQAVVQDLCRDPEDRGYGAAHITQVTFGATVRSIGAQAAAADRRQPVDLMVIDYLALLAPDRRRSDVRSEMSGVITDGKRLATTFRGGDGVPVVSPWQLTRNAQEEMARSGDPELRGLAETEDAGRAADNVIVLVADGAREQHRYQGMRVLILKNRAGQIRTGDDALAVRVDYATSYVSDRVGASDLSGAGTNGAGELAGLDSLLMAEYA